MSTFRTCNEIRIEDIGTQINVRGFVSKTRNLGSMIFIDLRDRSGILQLVIGPEHLEYELAKTIRNEFVISISGIVVERQSKNPKLATGDIEITIIDFNIISQAKTTPLIIAEQTDALEEVRLKYRYLDLRRPNMQSRLILRHQVNKIIHAFLDNEAFIEVETPILSKSTPEGARDYLVPSRVQKGEFYALPQSPQLYKMLLMLSGLEKYYQIVRCFRDEDLRVDRQPEFTQLDIEQAFASEEDMYALIENLLARIFKKTKNIDIKQPFPKMQYETAMNTYGSDKPDTRFDMTLIDVTASTRDADFSVFALAEHVKFIAVPNGAKLSRKEIDALTEYVKIYQAKGLAWLKYQNNTLEGPIAKFFSEEEKHVFIQSSQADDGALLLFVADSLDITNKALGQLRIHLARKLELIPADSYNFLWVIDWPLFEYDADDERFVAAHHPFTAPKEGTEYMLKSEREQMLARAYDIVLNGYEIGGGSVRIHDPKTQKAMFEAIGMSENTINEQFGFLLEAYSYGAPTHAGIALGIDRLMMILTGTDSITDVIAFPKTLSARDLMMQSPSAVSAEQLSELAVSSLKEK
ncbi:aspartyl-tRNA synthetase [Erysipelotrichaceae bacterium]|nr:aspartyl-tRNA synthetase [Erysipelotrichaceae bacterium]